MKDKKKESPDKKQAKAEGKQKSSKKAPEQTVESKPPQKALWRSLFVLAEVCAVLLLIVGIVLGLSVWRLMSGPVDISFAKTYVETALRDEERGLYATLESGTLYWPDLQGPLLLGIEESRVMDSAGQEIIHVEEIALSLSKSQLLIGKIKPLSLIIKRPSLRVIRTEDNNIDFGLGTFDTVATEKVEEQSEDQKNLIADILGVIKEREKAIDNSPLASLKSFEIENARTMVEDHKLQATWFLPDFSIRFESIEEGLLTNLHIELSEPEEGVDTSYIEAEMVLSETESVATFETTIHNFDAQLFSTKFEDLEFLKGQGVMLNGEIRGILDKTLMPVQVLAQLSSDDGYIKHDQISPEPVPYRNFKTLITYDKTDGEKLNIDETQITLKDVTVHARANMNKRAPLEKTVSEDDESADEESVQEDSDNETSDESESGVEAEEAVYISEGYSGSVEVSIDDIPHTSLVPLWPTFLVGDSSEEWIIKKMSGGELSGLKARADIDLSKNDAEEWSADLSGLIANFAFTNMDMDYRSPLPAVKKATGAGEFNLDTDILSIDISDAELNTMKVKETKLIFTDVAAEGKGAVEMDIKLNGSLRSVFEYISEEPIDLKDELDMDISKVKGDTDLAVKMSFPTKDDLEIEEIKMDINGTVRNGYVPDILEGLPLEGGPFNVNVNNERYTVKGSGLYGGRKIDLEWLEYLSSKGKDFKNKADVTMVADEDLRKHFGIDLSEFISGNIPVKLTYKATSDTKSQIYIEADATPARFFVEPFEYVKEDGQKGRATMTAHLNKNILSHISGLQASAPGFKVEGATLSFVGSGDQTRISQAKIKRFVIGETIAGATVDFAESGLMKILMEGPYFDLRPFVDDGDEKGNGQPGKDQPYEGPPQIISLAVDQMRTADKETVQYAKIYADIDNQGRFNQLEMDAIAGSGDIYLRYKPDSSGRRTFRLEADDAGAALKAFDVYRNIRGGKLVIYGEPISSVYDRNLVGVAQITDFKVVDAPSLARLLGALSLPGIMQLLNDDGLSFSKLEAGFDWLYRRKGALLVLKDGRTSGNSLGLTFDGVFDNAALTVDVSGTIIPLSGINKAIGSIPLIGDILSGGTGAIFAATYSMKGPSENPKISVNPLSVLTPGILRRILFE